MPKLNLASPGLHVAEVKAALGLAAHPEGGWYRETWRDAPADGKRGAATSILFMLAAGEHSAWHRVDAAEIWAWHAGAAMRLQIADDTGRRTVVLGPDLAAGQQLQAVVPAGAWQAARPKDGWSLVGCIVAPAFSFAGFELAPAGFTPTGGE
jgi:predicted cupin superfamily sugar epimerase